MNMLRTVEGGVKNLHVIILYIIPGNIYDIAMLCSGLVSSLQGQVFPKGQIQTGASLREIVSGPVMVLVPDDVLLLCFQIHLSLCLLPRVSPPPQSVFAASCQSSEPRILSFLSLQRAGLLDKHNHLRHCSKKQLK